MRLSACIPIQLAILGLCGAGLCSACLWGARPAWGEEDAAAIVEKAFEAARANEVLVREYVFHERIEERRFTRKGVEKRREAHTWDVTLFEGGDYRRLIARNDRPLSEREAAREQRKLDRHIRRLRNETPRQRSRRLARIEREREEGEELLEEIPKAFDFRLVREGEIDGIPIWVLSAEPKAGYRPSSRVAKVLTRLRATLWVSREDHAWVQAEIEMFDDLTWMGIYKLRKGTQIRFEQRRLDGGVWVTENWHLRLRAKIALVYRYEAELTGSYSDFRRFSTETTLTDWTPKD